MLLRSSLILQLFVGDNDIAALEIITYLFQPMSIIIQKPGNTCHTIRSSKLEQASAFITQITVNFFFYKRTFLLLNTPNCF